MDDNKMTSRYYPTKTIADAEALALTRSGWTYVTVTDTGSQDDTGTRWFVVGVR